MHGDPYTRFFSTDCLVFETFETLRGKVEAPCFKIDDIGIWGATAMILREFSEIYNEFENKDGRFF